MPTPPDPNALLCERCGYVIDGLDPGSTCPECGLPTAESMPELRPGSPWQVKPSLATWVRTTWMVHRSPQTLMRQIRDGGTRDRTLLVINLIAVAVIVGMLGGPLARAVFAMSAPPSVGVMLLAAIVVNAPWFVLSVIFCWIEARGVVFFSAKRGWRVPRAIAWAIVAHASITWVWAWIGVLLSLFVLPVGTKLFRPLVVNTIFEPLLELTPPLLGFIIGMLVFESLVYVGVRQCRFANVPLTPHQGVS